MCTLWLVIATGGLASPFAPIFVTLPSAAFSAAGARGVVTLGGLALAGCLVTLGLDVLGMTPPVPIDGDALLRARFVLFAHCISIFVVVGVGVETLRARSTRALAQARDRAESASRAKGDFLAMMSHELRTPLAGLVGALSLAADETKEPETRERLALASSSAASLRALLDDVLDFSRIEAGRLSLSPEPVAPGAVLREVVALFTPAARSRELELRAEVGELLSRGVRVDALRLRQVISNLVGNAIKFTERGGIVVRASAEDRGARRAITIEVEDSGVGMNAAQLARLFEPFVQVHERRGGGGTGLGLVISRSIVEQMGGTLSMESEPGRGTRAKITLELEAAELRASVSAPSEIASVGEKAALHVLVAEDAPVLRRVIEALLRREGCSVRFAEDGQEALRLVMQERFDVVLMDVHMPELDGLGATRAIRALDGDAARVPIYGLSAGAFAENEQSARDAGMDGYLVKPVRREELVAVLASVRAAREQADAPSA